MILRAGNEPSEALVDEPDSALLHFNLGDVAYRQKKYDEAQKSLAASVPFPSRLGRPSEFAALLQCDANVFARRRFFNTGGDTASALAAGCPVVHLAVEDRHDRAERVQVPRLAREREIQVHHVQQARPRARFDRGDPLDDLGLHLGGREPWVERRRRPDEGEPRPHLAGRRRPGTRPPPGRRAAGPASSRQGCSPSRPASSRPGPG